MKYDFHLVQIKMKYWWQTDSIFITVKILPNSNQNVPGKVKKIHIDKGNSSYLFLYKTEYTPSAFLAVARESPG